MRNDLFKLAGKGAAGFLCALAVWFAFSLPYTRLLASLSQSVVRVAESPPVTSITPSGTLMVVDRTDFPASPSSMQLAVQSTDITFNFILLTTLFAARARALSDRNVFGFVAAAAALVVVHVGAVVSFVEGDYASRFGAWSTTHYGPAARTFWIGAPYFYSIVGSYAFAFALWWLFRAPPAEGRNLKRKK